MPAPLRLVVFVDEQRAHTFREIDGQHALRDPKILSEDFRELQRRCSSKGPQRDEHREGAALTDVCGCCVCLRVRMFLEPTHHLDGIVAHVTLLNPAGIWLEQRRGQFTVDDSHAVGFVGEHGAGTPELFGVQDRVDILTGTLGKALGGASGGYTCARAEIVEMLRQKSRPYLFSNSLAPAITGATLRVLELIQRSGDLLAQLRENTSYFRTEMTARGFEIPESTHPIVPVMIGDAVKAARMADEVLARGVYVRAFSYPVVPKGKARIRTQLSATLTRADLDRAIDAFVQARDVVEA